jgi:hypothetical protein
MKNRSSQTFVLRGRRRCVVFSVLSFFCDCYCPLRGGYDSEVVLVTTNNKLFNGISFLFWFATLQTLLLNEFALGVVF